jgi:hypothetical protein
MTLATATPAPFATKVYLGSMSRDVPSCSHWLRPRNSPPPCLLCSTHMNVLARCLILTLNNFHTACCIVQGTVSRDFLLLVFFINQFPPSPEYPISNFFENSLRYSQVKVHHRYQRHWCQLVANLPPVSLVLLKQVANLPPVSTIPAANLLPVSTTLLTNFHQYQRHQRQICHRYQRHRWQTM